ncbi:MAG: signal recognition particle-docking protein FtsY [Dethiosulfovibrio peptidovorans]|nr:MAG: signal recognition particle-docking protein FtsY [Dethiosulfovibrio peptidovorans]
MAFFKGVASKIQKARGRWGHGLAVLFSGKIDESFWEELEERLIAGDVGLDLSEHLVSRLRDLARRDGLRDREELLRSFQDMLVEILEAVPAMGEPIGDSDDLAAVVMVGVNGSGKTTTTGKLAHQLTVEGRKVLLAGADTFRAAASEQLQVWGDRLGLRVIAHQQGSDAAAVAYDAINAARSASADVVFVDTAGRLQSKHNLMEELGKIYRVVTRELGSENVESLLVLDAVMGQNALQQARLFNEAAPLTGVVLAKYDNSAKGGIVLAIAHELKLPIRYIGLGESMEDLAPFEPRTFVDALLSQEQEL